MDDGTESNETRLGAVRDIQLAVEKLPIADDCLVMAGDNVLDFSLCSFIRYAQEKGTSCNMRYREENEQKLRKAGVAEIGEDDLLISLEEKYLAVYPALRGKYLGALCDSADGVKL